MIASRTQARDEMLAMVKTAAVLDGSPITIVYDDTEEDAPTNGTWLRATMSHGSGSRAALGPHALHTQTGILFVQIFTEAGNGLVLSDQIAKLIEDAFRGKASVGGVVFYDVVTKEIGETGVWFQANVEVEFSYDLVGA